MAKERKLPAQLLNKTSVINILAAAATIDAANAGQTFVHTIQQVGLVFDVTKKVGEIDTPVFEFNSTSVLLRKKIISLKAFSASAKAFHRTKLRDGVALEDAGDLIAAHWMYQAYLDKSRFTASILSTEKQWAWALQPGDQVKLTVEVYKGEGDVVRGINMVIVPATIAAPSGKDAATALFDFDDMPIAAEIPAGAGVAAGNDPVYSDD